MRSNEASDRSVIIDADTLAYATATATHMNHFDVQLADANHNYLDINDWDGYTTSTSVYLTSDAANAVVDETAVVANNGDGTVSISYTPTTTGANKLNILVNGAHIAGSPFEIQVLPGQITGATSTATGTGLTDAVAGQEAEFVIQARDSDGNSRDSDMGTFTATLTMNSVGSRPVDYDTMVDNGWGGSEVVNGVVDYIGDGQYRVT